MLRKTKPARRQAALRKAVCEPMENRVLLAAPEVLSSPTYFNLEHGLELVYPLNQNVSASLSPADLAVTNLFTGTGVATQDVFLAHGPSNTETFTFRDFYDAGALTVGNYEAQLLADGISNPAGEFMLADHTTGFFLLYGDANRDRRVDSADEALFNYGEQHLLTGWSNGDFDSNNSLDIDDRALMESYWGMILPAPPTAPNTLIATGATGANAIYLSWAAPDWSHDGFHVYRSEDGGFTWTLHEAINDPTQTATSDTGLSEGSKYTYRIRAYSLTAGESLTSNKFSAVTFLPTATDLYASNLTTTSLLLNWRDNAHAETGYQIHIQPEGGVRTLLMTVPADGSPHLENDYSQEITGLLPGVEYTFSVTAIGVAANSADSLPCIVTTLPHPDAPTAPSNLAGTATSSAEVALTWNDNSNNETGFEIQMTAPGGVKSVIQVAPQANTGQVTYPITGLEPASAYTFRVRSKTAAHSSVWTESVSVSTPASPLEAPTGLQYTLSEILTHLSWTDNSTTESGFRIEMSSDNFVLDKRLFRLEAANATSAYLSTLTPFTQYYFRVRAVSGNLISSPSNIVSFTTGDVLSVPTGLSANIFGETSVALAWTDNASNEAVFIIQRSKNGQGFIVVGQVPANATTFNAHGQDLNTTYYFKVTVLYDEEVGLDSEVVSIVTPGAFAAPTNLTAVAIDSTHILLTWKDNSSIEDYYEVERRQGQGAWQSIASPSGGAGTLTMIDNPATGPTYTYRVRAVRGSPPVYSPWSNEATETATAVSAPTNLTATPVSPSEINLAWNDTSLDETGFEVETLIDNGVGEAVIQRVILPPNARHYSAVGLGDDQTYKFRVAARRNAARSVFSNKVNAKTPAIPEGEDEGTPGWFEDVGTATPGIMEENVASFGTFDPGIYSVIYQSGILSYSNNHPGFWGGHTYSIRGDGAHVANLPGPLRTTAQEYLQMMATAPAVQFEHRGGTIGIQFVDGPYDDNRGSGVTWRLRRYHPPKPPEPPEDLPRVTLGATKTQATEGADDSIELKFSRPALPDDSKPAVNVKYTLSGTAKPQDDYTGPSGASGFGGVYSVTIPQGADDVTVKVKAKEDDLVEGTESFFASIRATGLYLFGAAVAQGNIVERIAKVTEVTYSESNPVRIFPISKDDGSGPYTGAHWKDIGGDGDADDADENKWPVAYLAGSAMKVEAKFALPAGFTAPGMVKVRGTAPSDTFWDPTNLFDFYADSTSTGDSTLTITGTTMTVSDICSRAFWNTVAHFDTFDVKWEVSFDNGSTWTGAGTTKNQIYVLNKNPLPGSSLFHTVVHVSTRAAQGAFNDAAIVSKIWDDFADRRVYRWQDKQELEPLRYLHDNSNDGNHLYELLDNGWGRCRPWADFFIATLRVQGIAAESVTIRPDATVVPPPPYAGYTHVANSDMLKANPGPAQGSVGSYGQRDFLNHALVWVPALGKLYDPSYGGAPHLGLTGNDALIAWEDASLEGLVFVYHLNGDPNTPGYKDVPNRMAIPDLLYLPAQP